MATPAKLVMAQDDFDKLTTLLAAADDETASRLADELTRATIVPAGERPTDAVGMHSRVKFMDLETGKESTVTIVFPPEVNIDTHKISVLSPIGSALIGLRVGQSIAWPMPTGKERRVKVLEVGGD